MSYDTLEAARLISWSNKQAGVGPLSEAELTKWIDDGVGLLEWEDVWDDEGEETKCIDFPTLISLRLICLLHLDTPCPRREWLNETKATTQKLRQELGVKWPFASKRIWDLHDNHTPVTAEDLQVDDFKSAKEHWRHMYWQLWAGRHPRSTEVNLIYGEDGVACAWLPAEDIKIDPRFVSGSPCLAGTRIPTWVFPGMHASGDSIEELADDYGITKERVELALEWERQLAIAGI